jgi:hypothetical protein
MTEATTAYWRKMLKIDEPVDAEFLKNFRSPLEIFRPVLFFLLSLLLFVFWIAINGASYFTILKLTGKKRFFHTFVATSFVMFLASIVMSAQNTSTITFLSGYWVAWYLLMTVIGWFLLQQYK